MDFNPAPSTVMHLDINSCFASIEQQANPILRGRPVAVAAYTTPRGCILAASVEAKKFGVKTGLRVEEGKLLCPDLLILPADPPKYRHVHLRLRRLLSRYTPDLVPKSIDEFVLKFTPADSSRLFTISRDIKSRLRRQIGDFLTVSIGLGPNRFLAKVASNLKKPDGLCEINFQNYFDVYSRLTLPDLHGINHRLTARLGAGGIYTVTDFLAADVAALRSVFHSIGGYYWYLRLRGYEIDDIDFGRKSFGCMYSLPRHYSTPASLSPILHKLVEKMSFRLRRHGFQARGFYLGLLYTDRSFWHRHYSLRSYLFSAPDIYRIIYRLLLKSPPDLPVQNIAVSCFDLSNTRVVQLDLFGSIGRQLRLSGAADAINRRYGNFVISSAAMVNTGSLVPDRIGFGNIGDLTG